MKIIKNKLSVAFVVLFLMYFGVAYAHTEDEDTEISAFRSFKDVSSIPITVPTVVEVPFDGEYLERAEFAVHEDGSDSFQPYFFNVKNAFENSKTRISSIPVNSSVSNLIDGKYNTSAEYQLPETYKGEVEFLIKGEQSISASSLNIVLDNNVAMPTFIEIRTNSGGKKRIIVARKRILGNTVVFPRWGAGEWIIKLWYAQPLRISELQLMQEDVERATTKGLRFLAQPKETYRIYFNPDRNVFIKTGESGDLRDDKDVLSVVSDGPEVNILYKAADVDGDGIADRLDNCVRTANTQQIDSDNNNRGDACDDFDKDGVINSKDNCPNNPNRRQLDEDADGIGDVCDGEESRITEKYIWLPWVGIFLVAVIIFMLFFITIKGIREKEGVEGKE